MATAAPELLPAPGPMAPAPFAVAEQVQETGDTWTLTLEPLAGDPPSIAPGQFAMVYAFGIGEVPISVSGATGVPGPVVLTVRAVGAVTDAICRSGPGSVLGLRGPFGNAWPVAEAAGGDVVVVAGGIGLAPLRPVLLHALARRSQYGEVVLLYGARTPADLLYRPQLDSWGAEVTVDTADTDWRRKVGVVPKLIPGAPFDPAAATAFVVGPEVMMRFTIQALVARGLPPGRIFVSLERNMRCGLGHCGHCQLGPTLICRDGPVYSYEAAAPWLEVREL
jgi:anaerobic sulfite reductase subunit B